MDKEKPAQKKAPSVTKATQTTPQDSREPSSSTCYMHEFPEYFEAQDQQPEKKNK
jgi:hypothetical protein